MDQAIKLKKYYDELVKRHKKLVKENDKHNKKAIINLKLENDLKTTGEEMDEFARKYEKFIRRRNSSYGRFQIDNYVTWLKKQNETEKIKHSDNAGSRYLLGYNQHTISAANTPKIQNENNGKERKSNIRDDLTQVGQNHLTNLEAFTKGRIKLQVADSYIKETSSQQTINNKQIPKTNTNRNKKKDCLDKIHHETANTRKYSKNKYEFKTEYKLGLTTNNDFFPYPMDNDKKMKRDTERVKGQNAGHQISDTVPYHNFYLQNNPSNDDLRSYSNFDCLDQFNKTNQKSMMCSQDQMLPPNIYSNMQEKQLYYGENSRKTPPVQNRKFSEKPIQYINPGDLTQETMHRKIKQKNEANDYHKPYHKNSPCDVNSGFDGKEEACNFTDPTSYFKIPLKCDDEESMGHYIYKTVYGNDHPTDEEIQEMNEMYDVYLETICHTSCMIAKSKQKNIVDSEDMKLAIKMEFDVVFPDDVVSHPVTEIDGDHEKKMAMIAKEKHKKGANK